MPEKGKIFVIAAPSGTGKTSIIHGFLAHHPEIVYSVSATTRTQRPGEVNGVDYFFVSGDEFQKKIENHEFLEWEKVYDYYYGTLRHFIEDTITTGKHILVEVDVKGALSVKNKYPDSNLIFFDPPSYEELEKRLRKRNTDNANDIIKRLERAKMELAEKNNFDLVIVNDDLDRATQELENYIKNKIQ